MRRCLPLLSLCALLTTTAPAGAWVGFDFQDAQVAEIPPEVAAWSETTKFFLKLLRAPGRYVCRVRPRSRDRDGLPPWLDGEHLAKRTGVPLWVLQNLNPGYDLEQLDGESRVRVFSHPTWPNYQECLTPVMYEPWPPSGDAPVSSRRRTKRR